MKMTTEYGPCRACGGTGIEVCVDITSGHVPCCYCHGTGRVKTKEVVESEGTIWTCAGCGGLAPCQCGRPARFATTRVEVMA